MQAGWFSDAAMTTSRKRSTQLTRYLISHRGLVTTTPPRNPTKLNTVVERKHKEANRVMAQKILFTDLPWDGDVMIDCSTEFDFPFLHYKLQIFTMGTRWHGNYIRAASEDEFYDFIFCARNYKDAFIELCHVLGW